MISYAQAREDVLLHRALHHVSHDVGFYIDVGAYHPYMDSVTKHFYDHGWRGVNIEPNRDLFPSFPPERPRDVNLQCAASREIGEVTFYAVEGQLGTLESRFATRHAASGIPTHAYVVPATTLAQICLEHAPADIHFLKIDVEGHEGAVLGGMDFSRYRPWVLVIEATEPNRLDVPTYDEWHQFVLDAGYTFAFTDVLNRYYVADEHAELLRFFAFGADDYVLESRVREINELRARLASQADEINNLRLQRPLADLSAPLKRWIS